MSPDRGGGCRLGGGWIHSCSCCAGCAIPAAPARPRRARAPTGRARSTSAGSAQGAPWGWSRRRVDGDTLDVLEYRHDWCTFAFTVDLFKFIL